MIRYLSRSDIENLKVSGVALADGIEKILAAAANGCAQNNPKSSCQLPDGRLFQSILAVGIDAPAPPYAATKVVGLSPFNHDKNLPHIGSVIVLLDGSTGLPCCIMDGSWITAMRTAALSLVVARRFARPGAQRMGFIACGAQARAHLAVFQEEFPIDFVTAYSRRPESAKQFVDWCTTQGVEAQWSPNPQVAVTGQDIVVSSVPGQSDPLAFLRAEWLDPGSFAALVDLGRSWSEPGFDDVDHRIVDSREQAEKAQKLRRFTPAGPYTMDLQELIEVPTPLSYCPNQRAVFVFQGLALADLAAAAIVYDQSIATNTGTLLPE
jgi:ornithine cyclodeaminase/alanine dehydrogenase